MRLQGLLVAAWGVAWISCAASAESARPDATCHVQVTAAGADGVLLMNPEGQECPCADTTRGAMPDCAGGVKLVVGPRSSPHDAWWPRFEFFARAKWTDELFIRTIGTGRPITLNLDVGGGGYGREGWASLEMGRAGHAYWWQASWACADSGWACGVRIRRLRHAPGIGI
jgi:hypothetical protein